MGKGATEVWPQAEITIVTSKVKHPKHFKGSQKNGIATRRAIFLQGLLNTQTLRASLAWGGAVEEG